MKKNLYILIILLLSILSFSNITYAEKKAIDSVVFENIFKYGPFNGIDLSSEQKNKIIELINENNLDIDFFKEQIKQRISLNEFVLSDEDLDTNKIFKDKFENLIDKYRQFTINEINTEHAVFKVLNKEQQEKYKENIKNEDDMNFSDNEKIDVNKSDMTKDDVTKLLLSQ